MALTKADFDNLKKGDEFNRMGDFNSPKVDYVTLDEENGRIVWFIWPSQTPCPCVWHEGKVAPASGRKNPQVDEFNGKFVSVRPEDADLLAERWLEEKKITQEDYNRMIKAIGVTSQQAMNLMSFL